MDSLRVIHHFGSRLTPFGVIPETEWRRLRPRWKQVHGVGIGRLDFPGQELGEVDGIWTELPDQPVAVVTADCVPIFLERSDLKAVGALHAGWRGTEARIIDAFFRSLPGRLANPGDWVAKIGPSIRSCCYRVGGDLLERFSSTFPDLLGASLEPLPGHLDLVAVNLAELRRLGVRVGLVHADCTFCSKDAGTPNYFSYRRGDRDARQLSMISLSSKK
ncbi:MAG: polyphenol oxidase family protein [Bdellovibrionales bacterium]|nr:polyphenol oxidase family protein [Bdellovibrionales bacterium]